jgi:hypothetical protein
MLAKKGKDIFGRKIEHGDSCSDLAADSRNKLFQLNGAQK